MNITGQRWETVLDTASPLSAAGSIGASALSRGYGWIVGILYADASAKGASGLRVFQSSNGGTNWDFWQDWVPSACSGSIFTASLAGNAVKVEYRTDGAAATFRTLWQLKAVW